MTALSLMTFLMFWGLAATITAFWIVASIWVSRGTKTNEQSQR